MESARFVKVAGRITPIVTLGTHFLTQTVHSHLVKESNVDSSAWLEKYTGWYPCLAQTDILVGV